MSRFKVSLEAAGALGVLREVSTEGGRFICYTGFSEGDGLWLMGASDGVDVWRVGLSEQEVRECSRERGEHSYLNDISHTLSQGEVQLLQLPDHLSLCLKCASEQLEFALYELSAAERRLEMKTLLLNVWDKFRSTQTQLKECQKQLEETRKQKASEQPVFADVSLRSGKSATKPKKPAGHSLVNPSSKRRKAAKGVVFGDDN